MKKNCHTLFIYTVHIHTAVATYRLLPSNIICAAIETMKCFKDASIKQPTSPIKGYYLNYSFLWVCFDYTVAGS